MDLRVPDTSKPEPGALFTSPRRVRKWLKELPVVNIGETARQFYRGLRDANRLEIPARDRLEIMEAMRPTARFVLDHLRRHVVSRALPLPSKARRIVQLNQSLLYEMASGYKLALIRATEGRERLDTGHTALAVHRALRYTEQILFTWAEVYMAASPRLWQDIHRLYDIAERRELERYQVADQEHAVVDRSSVTEVYLHVNLLFLCEPHALHLGEADRLLAFFERVCRHCSVAYQAAPDATGGVVFVRLEEAAPPKRVDAADVPRAGDVRFLQIAPVIDALKEEVQRGERARPREKGTLSADLARRVLKHLTEQPRRRFSRSRRDDQVPVALGIRNIQEAILAETGDPHGVQDERGSQEPEREALHMEPKHGDFLDDSRSEEVSHDLWDRVARGNVTTGLFTAPSLGDSGEHTRTTATRRGPSWQYWHVCNASAGGYCLLWDAEEASRAQIGELVGIRERGEHHWRTGVIRWMRYQEGRGLEVGVETISPWALPVTLQYADINKALVTPIEGLLLPALRNVKQPATVLTPLNQFRAGDEVIISLYGRENRVTLTVVERNTSFFTQFQYTNQRRPKLSQDTDTFDSLWSDL